MSVKYDPAMKKWVVDDRIEIWEHKYLVLLSTLGHLVYGNFQQSYIDEAKEKLDAHMKRKPA